MEETSLYRPILKKAWAITKKYKNLWFFGLFVAILGLSGEYEILIRAFYNPAIQTTDQGIIEAAIEGAQSGWADAIITNQTSLTNVWNSIISQPSALIFIALIIVLAVAISLFLIWLSVISQIGLIKNADQNSKNRKATLNQGIDFAVTKFWSVLLSNIILKIIIFLLFLILGFAIIALSGQGLLGTILYYLAFIIFVVIVFTVSFLIRYQIMYLILNKESFFKSWKSAFDLFKNNWLISLEMALILFLFYILAAILTSLIALIVITSIAIIFKLTTYSIWILALLGFIILIAGIALTFLITAILNTFQWSSWVILFNRLNQNQGLSRIIRTAEKIPNYFKK